MAKHHKPAHTPRTPPAAAEDLAPAAEDLSPPAAAEDLAPPAAAEDLAALPGALPGALRALRHARHIRMRAAAGAVEHVEPPHAEATSPERCNCGQFPVTVFQHMSNGYRARVLAFLSGQEHHPLCDGAPLEVLLD